MKKFKVVIGTPARSRSAIVEAESPEYAIGKAIDKIVSDGKADREWCEKYASDRDKNFGTCSVKEI